MPEVICSSCDGRIESRDDLVVASRFGLEAYHNECYAKEMKSLGSVFMGIPVNSLRSTISVFVVLFIVIIVSIVQFHFLVLLLGIVMGGYRLASWYLFERHLK